MKKWKQRKHIITIIVLFLCLYIAMESCVFFMYNKNIKRIEKEYTQTAQESVNGFADMLGHLLYSYMQSSNIVFEQNWYYHLRNYSGFYEEEFDSQTRKEIQESIIHIQSSMYFVRNLFLYVPNIDTVICPSGWLSSNKFARINDDVKINVLNDTTYETEFYSNSPLLIVNDPTMRKYPAYMVYVLDEKKIVDTLMQLVSENTVYIHATLAGAPLFTSGSYDRSNVYFTAGFTYPSLMIEFGNLPANVDDELRAMILISIVIFLALLLIVFCILSLTLKPLKTIILESGGKKSDFSSPYDYINRYIADLRHNQSQLMNEKDRSEAELKHFFERARRDILLGMLSSRYFRFNDPDVITAIPWLNDGFEMSIFVLAESRREVKSIREADILEGISESIEITIDIGRIALVWYQKTLTSDEIKEYVYVIRHEWSRINSAMCFNSDVFCENLMIVNQYEKILGDMQENLKMNTVLMKETKSRITELVQSADLEELTKTVQWLSMYYEPKDIVNYINAILDKPAEEISTWDEVYIYLTNVIQVVSENVEPKESLVYLQYIDDHYSDPDLNIGKMADYFGNHRTSISKWIKEASGKTFTDYVHSVRIREAKRRLDAGDTHVMQIATDVGYISYSTFKRAFQQYTGKTPMEYKQQKTDNDKYDGIIE